MFSVFVASLFNLEVQQGWQYRLSSPSSNDFSLRGRGYLGKGCLGKQGVKIIES